MTEVFDVAVVGAGPAGLAATVAAGELGARVVLVDAGAQPGGQFWRHPDERTAGAEDVRGHHGWGTFVDLRRRLRRLVEEGRVDYRPRTQVWFVDPPRDDASEWAVSTTGVTDGADAPPAATVHATRLVLCPGGYDRQLPIPGWDLPGVMAAGGVQALLKASGTLAGGRALVAGTGPFLLPVASALARAGATVVSVCEAGDLTGWVRHAAGAMRVPAKGFEGAGYAATLLRHRVPYRRRTGVVRIEGDDRVRSATVARLAPDGRVVTGSERRHDVDLVALGWGFTPSMELVLSAGADVRVDVDESVVAVVDDSQRSSVPRLYVAGEATGVGGAAMATAEGELAGSSAAGDMGRAIPSRRMRRLRRVIRRAAAFAHTMHRAHAVPPRWSEWLTPDTIVCRCEEVTCAAIDHARDDLGAADPRTVKLVSRAGMGWCQGRVCGSATAKLAVGRRDWPLDVAALVSTGTRPFAVPVSLTDLSENRRAMP